MLWLGGCAVQPSAFTNAESLELESVPFFAQTEYDCGPAALATVLVHEGIAVAPDDLAPAVYVEGLRGSLQAELLAATRRHGLIPYPIEPSAEALIAALADERPVLVLQNLGFARAPVWHYAVVVGFDAERGRVVLRSGEERRRTERAARFLRSWRLADYWGFVATEPGAIAAGATPARYLRALVDAERTLPAAALERAHEAALAHWPGEPLVALAAANFAQSRARWHDAIVLYRRVLAATPGDAVARNNLAHALFEAGCREAALGEARAALAATAPGDRFRAAIEDTVADLETRRPAAAAAVEAPACRT